MGCVCVSFLNKYVLYCANIFIALAGLTLVAVGAKAQVHLPGLSLVAVPLQAAPVVAIVVGSLSVLAAIGGIYGTYKGDYHVLYLYVACVIILLMTKIALNTWLYVKLNGVIEAVPNWLDSTFTRDLESFHSIESGFKCCGPTGPQSYMKESLPDTCCAAPPCIITAKSYPGCSGVASRYLRIFSHSVALLSFIIGAMELVTIPFGLWFTSYVRKLEIEERLPRPLERMEMHGLNISYDSD